MKGRRLFLLGGRDAQAPLQSSVVVFFFKETQLKWFLLQNRKISLGLKGAGRGWKKLREVAFLPLVVTSVQLMRFQNG